MASSIPLNIYPLTADTATDPVQQHQQQPPPSLDVIPHALHVLRPHLPVSIPLYRRLQFGRFFPDSLLLTNLDLSVPSPLPASTTSTPDKKDPWLLAFVDRSCRPETEVWLSCSWESAHPPSRSFPFSLSNDDDDTQPLDLLRRLLQTLRSLPLPPSIHNSSLSSSGNDTNPLHDPGADHSGLSRSDYASHAANAAILLFGSIHQRTTGYLQALDALNPAYAQGLVANHHFVFDVKNMNSDIGRELPEGLRWGKVRREDFALVRARTQIPRQERTLAVLPSIAIFAEGDNLVSWAFVGLDGSLTTLHVEAEYRGRGLAKAMTTKLFRESMEGFWEAGVKQWAHGIVIVGNVASTKMCQSLGGEILFDCYWLRVDLDRVLV